MYDESDIMDSSGGDSYGSPTCYPTEGIVRQKSHTRIDNGMHFHFHATPKLSDFFFPKNFYSESFFFQIRVGSGWFWFYSILMRTSVSFEGVPAFLTQTTRLHFPSMEQQHHLYNTNFKQFFSIQILLIYIKLSSVERRDYFKYQYLLILFVSKTIF